MDDFEKKLADNESALIQGLITLDEYKANCKEILATSLLIPKAHRSRLDVMDTGDWDSSGLCGVSALKLFKRGNS